jgi:hypothetical protein
VYLTCLGAARLGLYVFEELLDLLTISIENALVVFQIFQGCKSLIVVVYVRGYLRAGFTLDYSFKR